MAAVTKLPSPSARRIYPRVSASERAKLRAGEETEFQSFCAKTAPGEEELREDVIEKPQTDAFRHDVHYMATHISIAPPDSKLELTVRDTRARPMPASLGPVHTALEQPLRAAALERGFAPPGHPSDEFYDAAAARAPPQPVPDITQKLENEFLETIEGSCLTGEVEPELWGQYAKRAEELLITMPIDRILRVLKAFVMAKYRGADLLNRIAAELAREIKTASSTRLCQVFHWLARAGIRDQTLMSLMGNEALFRLSDDFVLDMYLEVMNAHARLDLRNPRLVNAMLREMAPFFRDLSKDQLSAVAPLTVMTLFTDEARVAYLSRCAELNLGLPVRMTQPEVLKQLRLLEDCLRLDYHPTTLPAQVQIWLQNLRQESEALDNMEPDPLSPVEEDILRVLQQEMDVAVTGCFPDGVLTLHLVVGKTVLQVMDEYEDYYVTPAMNPNNAQRQRLIRAESKLRQRLIWRRGWRVLTLDADEWKKLTDDIFKKDLLEELLVHGQKSIRP
ncbi:Uncharacterized protein SCF082_LOCUS39919 [Durusdinium trenchii]|uniref:RAP domain-containing protein n=1 Tax=Durusdinium trenchii TaxID=1381693 RepID=A0ABP0Q8D0_9DINO